MFETRVLGDLLEAGLHGDDLPAAINQGENAVELARSINYPYLLAGVLSKLARLHAAVGDHAAADRLAHEGATMAVQIR